jgi:hypothetical protein
MKLSKSLSRLAYEYRLEQGPSSTLRQFLLDMGIEAPEQIGYEGFIHTLARGFMKANAERGWRGGYSYKLA